MASAITRLIEFGQSPWYDNLTRAIATGGLRDAGRRARHPRRHVEPDDLREGDGVGQRLRRAAARGHGRGRDRSSDAYWDLVTTDIGHAADVLRPTTTSWDGHDGFVSVEVSPDLAHDTDGTIAQAKRALGAARPPQRDDQDPGDRRGHPRDRGDARRGHQRQRHADLLPRALRGGDRRVPRRARAAGRARRRHRADRVGRVVLREPGRHRDRPPAPRGSRRCAGRPRSPTPSSRTSTSSRRSPAPAGTRSRRRARACSGRCGRRRRRRTRPTPPRSTSTTLIGRDTVNTLAQASVDVLEAGDGNLRADTVLEGRRRGPRRRWPASPTSGVDFDDVTATLEREGVAVVHRVVRGRGRRPSRRKPRARPLGT